MTNEEKIENIKRYQADAKDGAVHALTCGVDSDHLPLVPAEIDNTITLKCETYGWTQIHGIPAFTMMWNKESIMRQTLIEGDSIFKVKDNVVIVEKDTKKDG